MNTPYPTLPDISGSIPAEMHYATEIVIFTEQALRARQLETTPNTPEPIVIPILNDVSHLEDFQWNTALGVTSAYRHIATHHSVITLHVDALLRDDGAVEFEYDINAWIEIKDTSQPQPTAYRSVATPRPITVLVHLRYDDSMTDATSSTHQPAFFAQHQLYVHDAIEYIRYHAPDILNDSVLQWDHQNTIIFNHCATS